MNLNTSQTEWNFDSLVSGDVEVQIEKEKEIIKLENERFVLKWKDRQDYLEDPLVLKEALDELESLEKDYGNSGATGYFLNLKYHQNLNDSKIKSLCNLMEDFSKDMGNKIHFFILNLGKTRLEKQEEFLSCENLSDYHNFLKNIFRRSKHYLNEEVENVLNLKSGPANDKWSEMVRELISKEEREVFTGEKRESRSFSEILGMIDNAEKKVRDSCAEAFNDILKKNSEIAASEINAIFSNKKIDDKLRNFSRPDESRIIGDDIDLEFVDGLISSVKKRFDLSHKYYELKSKLFGLEKLSYHERNLVYGSVDKKFSYPDAADFVHTQFGELDSEFSEIFKRFVENGDIDVYPKIGKWHGAFCSWGLKIHPTKILLNYMNRFDDVRVLAHESGHGINHELMKKQNSLNFGVSMAVAEVASNFAEEIVFNELLNNMKNEEEKLSALMYKLNNDVSSVFRQISCYLLEKKLHEEFRKKGILTVEEIGEIFREKMEAYMGKFVEQSPGSSNWWVYWNHIRNFFYVYSYASGVLISKIMIQKCNENVDFIKNIKEFLSIGRSKSPRESFRDIGIEISENFWEGGLNEIEKSLNEAWRLAEKLGKL